MPYSDEFFTLLLCRSENLRAVATKNRSNYRRLKKELEELTEHGMLMLASLQRPDANVMQRLAVQVLCRQLDQAWTYFSRSWRMQDHVYVQHLELGTFQLRFRELSAALSELEASAPMRLRTPQGARAIEQVEIDACLDDVDAFAQALQVGAITEMLSNQLINDLTSG